MLRLARPKPQAAAMHCTNCATAAMARATSGTSAIAAAVATRAHPWRRWLSSTVRTTHSADAATSSSSSSLQHQAPTRPSPSVASSSPSSAASLLLRSDSAAELPRPGSIVNQAAAVPYRPRKALPVRTQQLIDAALRPMRRKEHPDWLEKPFVRKMTLQERQVLLTAQHQKWDLEKMARFLRKTRSPLASLHWFIRVYSHAPVPVYHRMILAAGRFGQYERCDEYFKLLLQHHQPTPRTFMALLAAHASAGHTKKVEDLMRQMHEGAAEVVADKLPAVDPNAIFDPTDTRHALEKRLAKNTTFKFPCTPKTIYYLFQTHMVNNDTEAIIALANKLRVGEEIYPTGGQPLHLTVPLAELLMHYYALQRLVPEAIALIDWIEHASLPMTTNIAWSFFDAFKRHCAWVQLEADDKHDAQKLEMGRRVKKTPVDIDAVNESMRKQTEATEGTFDPMLVPALLLKKEVPAHLQRSHRLAPPIRDPFPVSVASKSSGLSRHKTFPPSPARRAVRLMKPSPLDATKEAVPLYDVINQMLALGFVPTANLINLYLAYYLENFYPALGKFPDVMLAQVKTFEAELVENVVNAAYNKAHPDGTIARPETDAKDALRSKAFAPFKADAQTYALLIQALMDRHPLKPSSASSPAFERAGPSSADQATIYTLRGEMREREIEPLLSTKVNMMQLMAYEEKWTDLYASFTLLWKKEKLRRETKLQGLQRQDPTASMTDMLKDEETAIKAQDDVVLDAEIEGEEGETKAASETTSSVADVEAIRHAFTQLGSSPAFTCMTLLPVFTSLSQRASLERMNLFFGIVSAAKDFPLTRDFFQVILQILGDRGHTTEIVKLLQVMKKDHHITPTLHQYNTLLSSMVHHAPTPTRVPHVDETKPLLTPLNKSADAREVMTNMFQTWELMKMLKLGYNQHTLSILLSGCVRFGDLADGRRLWHFIHWKTQFRPHVGMYSLYVDFLLQRDELSEALMVLRSQSFKDGLDWTLKECNMLLDYFASGKLLKSKHHTAAGPEDADTDGSALTAAQQAAVYVPSAEQQQLYATILAQSRSLSLRLLEWEKAGGKLGEAGSFEVTSSGTTRSRALVSHRQHHSPTQRAKYRTLEEKEEDAVTNLSTIPGALFAKLTPIIDLVDQFTGEAEKRREREAKKLQVRLLAQSEAAEHGAILQAQVDQVSDIAALTKEIVSPLPAETASTFSEFEAAREKVIAELEEVAPRASTKESSSTRPTKPIPEHVDPVANARFKAEKAALKAEKAAKRAEREASAAAQAQAAFSVTPVAASVNSVLKTLEATAERTRLAVDLKAPQHPAMLDGIDLCALRSEDRLATLQIVQLKTIQTSANLMAQPKELVKGRKAHHTQVVQAWLEQCTCCAKN